MVLDTCARAGRGEGAHAPSKVRSLVYVSEGCVSSVRESRGGAPVRSPFLLPWETGWLSSCCSWGAPDPAGLPLSSESPLPPSLPRVKPVAFLAAAPGSLWRDWNVLPASGENSEAVWWGRAGPAARSGALGAVLCVRGPACHWPLGVPWCRACRRGSPGWLWGGCLVAPGQEQAGSHPPLPWAVLVEQVHQGTSLSCPRVPKTPGPLWAVL